MPVYHVRSGVGVMINPTPLSRPEYEETKHIINSVHDEFAESVPDNDVDLVNRIKESFLDNLSKSHYLSSEALEEYMDNSLTAGMKLFTTDINVMQLVLTSCLTQMPGSFDNFEVLYKGELPYISYAYPERVVIRGDKAYLITRVVSETELTDTQRKELISEINGQLSDGWGENGTDSLDVSTREYYMLDNNLKRVINEDDFAFWKTYDFRDLLKQFFRYRIKINNISSNSSNPHDIAMRLEYENELDNISKEINKTLLSAMNKASVSLSFDWDAEFISE